MSEICIPEYSWRRVTRFEIPENSYICGYLPDGSTVYIGLTEYNGCQYPAKVIPSRMEAQITYGGVERKVNHWCKLLVMTYRS